MKNLETEYKKLSENEMPDLWDRIESKLPDKKKKPVFFLSATRYLAVAAAVVFLAVLIPGVLRLRENGLAKSESAYDGSTNVFFTETADTTCEEIKNEMAAADAETDTATESMAGASANEEAGANEEAAPSENSSLGEMLQDICAVTESEQQEPQEGKVLRDISLQVTAILSDEAQPVYLLCTADGREWKAVLSDDIDQVPVQGETYLCTLIPVQDAEWEYVIKKMTK